MSFNSPFFFLFLAIVVIFNWALPSRLRSLLLLCASLVFIGFYSLESIIVLIVYALFNFYFAKRIIHNRALLIVGIALNSIPILLYNYLNKTSIGIHVSAHFTLHSFIVVLGLSFYSLQNIAYLTEVYYQRMKPEASFCRYVLYASFFPRIISGPVMLPNEFLSQIDSATITKTQLTNGFNRILIGLFKKMVIADRLFPSVSSVFDYSTHYSGLTTVTAIYLFTIQLYFDFSGYTDIALGAAKMLGYDLKENFDIPLRSLSISAFWRRWHISLITWFTKYIYYPVAYNLRIYAKTGALAGIIITFFISAIWHGIGITFFAWAACHAVYLIFELFTKRFRITLSQRINKTIYSIISVFIVFNAVCFSNIFFRASSFNKSIELINNSISNFFPADYLSGFIAPLAVGGHQIDEFNLFITLFITSIVLLFERRITLFAKSERLNIYYVVGFLLLIMMFGVFNSGVRFIYMQF